MAFSGSLRDFHELLPVHGFFATYILEYKEIEPVLKSDSTFYAYAKMARIPKSTLYNLFKTIIDPLSFVRLPLQAAKLSQYYCISLIMLNTRQRTILCEIFFSNLQYVYYTTLCVLFVSILCFSSLCLYSINTVSLPHAPLCRRRLLLCS